VLFAVHNIKLIGPLFCNQQDDGHRHTVGRRFWQLQANEDFVFQSVIDDGVAGRAGNRGLDDPARFISPDARLDPVKIGLARFAVGFELVSDCRDNLGCVRAILTAPAAAIATSAAACSAKAEIGRGTARDYGRAGGLVRIFLVVLFFQRLEVLGLLDKFLLGRARRWGGGGGGGGCGGSGCR